ncbi:hypothetical protein VB779_16580 [Haloarculaceae archaeon H-GB11]|nr:hypothetical protein [Haloarculaceae archaeon H-GB11]
MDEKTLTVIEELTTLYEQVQFRAVSLSTGSVEPVLNRLETVLGNEDEIDESRGTN